MDTKKTEDFEKKLRWTLWLALLAGVLHKATTWVGGSALTWATVVLMGGFASSLRISDFVHITQLVLLIVFLLSLALFTCKLVTKKSLSTGSLQPLHLTYRDKRLDKVNAIKFLSFLLQCFLLFYCFHLSASNIPSPDWNSVHSYVFSKPHVDHNATALASLQACLQSCTTNLQFTAASALESCAQFCFPEQNSTSTNLQVSLFTFRSLVTATCFLGLLCNLYIFFRVAEFCWLLCSGGPKTLSLTRYHDEVLSRALNIGLVDADEFDAREFMLQGVGEDLVVRNIAPLEVKSQNEDFIKYLFYYPKGVEMVMGMLASEDTLRQQTAANMAGFWSLEPDMEKFGMELLSRLGEKLGMPGKVAEGAANSFKALAIAWKEKGASPLLKVNVSRSGGGRVQGGESIREISNSEAAGRGGGGTCNSGGGCDRGESSSVVPYMSARNAVSRSGSSGGGGDDELKWNVVHKVVDLVANKRLPTLQVYVRALDSFFMSESVKKWLSAKEKGMYDSIRKKLQSIIDGGDLNRSSENTGQISVTIDSSTKARTRLLAFSALDRLSSEVDGLQKVDRHLNEVEEKFVIWIDEVTRYDELCQKYKHRYGDWRKPGSKWEVRGGVFPPLPELEES